MIMDGVIAKISFKRRFKRRVKRSVKRSVKRCSENRFRNLIGLRELELGTFGNNMREQSRRILLSLLPTKELVSFTSKRRPSDVNHLEKRD